MATTRTFIAIEMPAQVVAVLQEVKDTLREGPGGDACRWSAAAVHLTLKFLGDVSDEQLPQVYQAVEAACRPQPPFRLVVAGVGCFPNTRRPRVVWAGVGDPSDALPPLVARMDVALATLGFSRESRPYTPHLTLGRLRNDPTQGAVDLGRAVASYSSAPLAELAVERVIVFGSILRPEGAQHRHLHDVELTAQEG
jgi:RNA 2',3'-cyclic 3'-phosphodiesterase